jgi:tetratricopeptide (TPR) repeat protein
MDLAQKAVSAALSGKWEEAIKVNSEILKNNSKDLDALNRLAKAYAELGKIKKAKEISQKVLKIDPFNPIATKCLAKWKAGGVNEGGGCSLYSKAEAFLEEPGKTKIVSLLHLGDAGIIAKLGSGDEVKFMPFSHRISVTTFDGKYIGRLPDDLSARLRTLLKCGGEYQILIKSTDPQEVKIFIRELKRSPRFKDMPSFATEKIEYISFTPPELVSKKDDLQVSVEEED